LSVRDSFQALQASRSRTIQTLEQEIADAQERASKTVIDGDAVKGFTVKGDANPSPDVQKPTLADVSGIVLFTIPFIGNFLTPKALLILVPLIFGLWLVIDALRKDT
jgi:hypothetical protein